MRIAERRRYSVMNLN